MNVKRNMLKIVAGAMLVAALPAGAQVLGGNVGGAMSGALGGGLGGGLMGGGSITGPDAAGMAGKVRERAQQAGQRTRDAAAGVDKRALGRDVSATGGAASSGSADRSGISTSSSGQAGASAKKSAPTSTPAPAAQ